MHYWPKTNGAHERIFDVLNRINRFILKPNGATGEFTLIHYVVQGGNPDLHHDVVYWLSCALALDRIAVTITSDCKMELSRSRNIVLDDHYETVYEETVYALGRHITIAEGVHGNLPEEEAITCNRALLFENDALASDFDAATIAMARLLSSGKPRSDARVHNRLYENLIQESCAELAKHERQWHSPRNPWAYMSNMGMMYVEDLNSRPMISINYRNLTNFFEIVE